MKRLTTRPTNLGLSDGIARQVSDLSTVAVVAAARPAGTNALLERKGA
ncbi:MAG: hypothetical protein R3D81_17205 [Thalassovita sp.]